MKFWNILIRYQGTEVAKVDNGTVDEESNVKKLPYPKSIAFIISNEFCERFNYYGMRTILVLYLTRKLDFSEDTATVIYHVFTSLVYFCCVIGAIIADSWWGKFKTIFYLSIVYVCGSFVIAIGAIEPLGLPMTAFTIIGLLLIAFGSGGIKPCVAAFGGDQFKMPEQTAQMAIFFSLFYFAINLGSLISTSITPILREDVHCFEREDCFSLAFGVPGALMFVSIIIFVCGKSLYITKEPAGNMFVQVCKCIKNALSTKRKEKKTNPREHWLDYAIPVHGQKLVEETKAVLKVLFLYLPLPMFWALFDQQGSRWTFQATRMDGALGSFSIKPDQLQVINPFLILVFIPLYEVIFYPLLNRIGIRRPLQKLTLGGVLAGVAFIISAIVEIQLEDTYPILPIEGEFQMRVYNGLKCNATVDTNIVNSTQFKIEPLGYYQNINVPSSKTYDISISAGACGTYSFSYSGPSEGAKGFFIMSDGVKPTVKNFDDSPAKSSNGYPLVRVLANLNALYKFDFIDKEDENKVRYTNFTNMVESINISPSKYELLLNGTKVDGEFELKLGGVYTIVVNQEETNGPSKKSLTIISDPNSVHMLWLVPQYVVLTLGEVMYSVTGLQFSYSQAPPNMKSVLQGGWQLTVGVGNLIVAIVAEAKIFNSQTGEFFLFAGLMFLDMAVFALLAWQYTYVEPKKEWLEEDGQGDENKTDTLAESAIDKKPTGIDNAAFKQE